MKSLKTYASFLLALLIVDSFTRADTRYVDINSANPQPSYTTWITAATNINDALMLSTDGDEIIISNGTYYITNTLAVSNAIAIKGASTNPLDVVITRDTTYIMRIFNVDSIGALLANLTVSNGLIITNSGAGAGIYLHMGTVSNCVITWNKLTCSNNTGYGAGIYVKTGIIDSCYFDNNGTTNYGTKYYSGGGIYIANNAQIKNCVIGTNMVYQGSGIFSGGTNVLISNCKFTNNVSYVGTVFLGSTADGQKIINSVFSNNTSQDRGRAIRVATGNSVLISNCYINCTNTCRLVDKGTYSYAGRGAIYSDGPSAGLVIDSCIIERHSDVDASTIYIGNGGVVRNCLLFANAKGGGAPSGAGGIYIQNGRVENCTIVASYASSQSTSTPVAGGIYAKNSYIVNSIIYTNFAYAISTNRAHDVFLGGTSKIENCCFGCITNEPESSIVNCITNYPQFVVTPYKPGRDAAVTNIHLQQTSPCINAGTNPATLENTKDIDGLSRIDPVSKVIDMGAYEFLPKITLFHFH
jgi:hypothetical protein